MIQKRNIFYKFLTLFAVISIVAVGCSTKKNTFMSRNYHNMLARFNGYFNAREIMKEERKNLLQNHQEDYSQILPIFIYPTESQSKSMIPQMDVIIEKCSKVIERHSIYKRKKEHVKWIDDCYHLIGQAEFYKGNLVSASQSFLYVYQAFKKEDIRYEAILWEIRTQIQLKAWDKVETYFQLVDKDVSFPKDLEGLYNAIYADYHIKKDQDFDKAIIRLEEAVNLTDDRDDKRRYTFILAQIYQKKSYRKKANDLYADVLKLRPDYIMSFNAKINRAIAYDVASNSAEDIIKQLKKMLRDTKNTDFYDQVYYALAELAITQGDEKQGVTYLKKSAKVSTSNVKQKALSYYRLADIYFARPDYINAQSYYDSTTIYLPPEHPDYYKADEKNKSLLDLVKNLKTVQLQDSLLKISALSEKDQKKLINDLIKDYQNEIERKKLIEQNALLAAQSNGGRVAIPGGSSEWYFYNPTSMAFGLSEFMRDWGQRKLEDNWRRSDKQATFSNNTNDDNTGITQKPSTDGSTTANDDSGSDPKLDQDNYLKDIPNDYNDKLAAHGKIVQALYNIGFIFKESFENYPEAIKSFERIVDQYDTSSKVLPAHYQLYRIYLKQEEKELAQVHKDWVLENHPFSEYAYIIKNPNYNKQTQATKEKIESFYSATYKLFEYGLYNDVISSCEKADSIFNSDHLGSKFDFLRAKAIGHSQSVENFKIALTAVINEYPEDPVKEKAQQILDYINNKKSTVAKVEESKYKVDDEVQHIVIILLNAEEASNTAFKNKVSQFNAQYFRKKELSISDVLLGENQNMLMVRSFSTKADALKYYDVLTTTSEMAAKIKARTYVITNENLRVLFQEKDIEEYKKFFTKNYVQA